MIARTRVWWSRLRVQQKVWVILLATFVPVLLTFALQAAAVNYLLTLQDERHQIILAREQIHILRRIAIDIEDAFRGYLLTRKPAFLQPLEDAETHLESTVARTLELTERMPGVQADVRQISQDLRGLMESKHALIVMVQNGQLFEVLEYVRSNKGLMLSDALRQRLRMIEDRLAERLRQSEEGQGGLAYRIFWGVLGALVGSLGLGLLGMRLLAMSITQPLAVLRSAVEDLGKSNHSFRSLTSVPIKESSDEIGELTRAYEDMASRIASYVCERDAINAISHEINTIGPDGLDGCLRRITDRAVELIEADVCLVMLRNEQMGCWVVEAASGDWHDRLYKSVMLWEEFPVSVRAFDTLQPAVGENLRNDQRPEVVRRNLIGDSMLSIPLLSRTGPFGVLVLLRERSVSGHEWNIRFAAGLAEEAALAISNARLYEAAHQKQKDLAAKLRHLEHLAENLAHDLKAPGKRIGELASILRRQCEGILDERSVRWLSLIEQNGQDLVCRVESILAVARVGARPQSVQPVDAASVIGDVLKARAGELEDRCARVHVASGLPVVACHRAYLSQVFDNLISNSLKFAVPDRPPTITITASTQDHLACFAVSDNGVGIPEGQRERVFDPFVRLQPEETQGSGIGLTIVRRIIELYGGRVWIDADGSAGCMVKFTLPTMGLMEDTLRASS